MENPPADRFGFTGLRRRLVAHDAKLPLLGAENAIKQPAHQADDGGPEECLPKTIHVETRNETAHDPKQDPVHDENKHPHGEEDEREAEEQQNGADKSVEDPEKKRHGDEGNQSFGPHPGELDCGAHRECGDHPAEKKSSHAGKIR
jgi:hypothetical protein